MTLILTGLLLLGQSLGINTGSQPKTVDDLLGAFNDLRASFLEEPAPSAEAGAGADEGADGEADAGSAVGNDGGEETPGVQVETYVIGQAQDWETTYYVVDSGTDGPTVMVVGGIHGDEPAVILASDRLVESVGDISAGRVILLPKANTAAIAAKKRLVGVDLNRAFPRGEGETVEAPLAAAIWQLAQEYQPDWLIDLHDESSDVTGQTVTHHPAQEEATWAARAMAKALSQGFSGTDSADPAEAPEVALDPDAAFATASGLVDGSLTKAAAELLDVRTLTLETHRRFTLTERADWLISGTTYLLTYLGMR